MYVINLTSRVRRGAISALKTIVQTRWWSGPAVVCTVLGSPCKQVARPLNYARISFRFYLHGDLGNGLFINSWFSLEMACRQPGRTNIHLFVVPICNRIEDTVRLCVREWFYMSTWRRWARSSVYYNVSGNEQNHHLYLIFNKDEVIM